MKKDIHLNKTDSIQYIISLLNGLSEIAKKSDLQDIARALSELSIMIAEKEGQDLAEYSKMAEIIDFYKHKKD